jgi:nucleotide-binding universal stress UspA family protein
MNSPHPPRIAKILCATDFSPFARKALGVAISLARRHGAEIEALHVFQTAIPFAAGDTPYYPVVVPVDPAARKAAGDELGRFVAAAADAGVPASMELIEGDPCTVILDHARSGGADLIAMGTHGRRGFDRWLMGSVAERVLAKSHCPVLTVAAEPEAPAGWPRPPVLPVTTKRILCALDLSENSGRTLAYASFLAAAAHARLTVLTVAEEVHDWNAPGEALSGIPFEEEFRKRREKAALARLEALVPRSAEGLGEIDRLVVTGLAHREILRAAREHGADLIVMGVHARAALGVSLLGSTARHVVREALCPVITVRPS